MPLLRRGEDRAGHNKMPAKGALATGLKIHDAVTWCECRSRHFRTTDDLLVCP
ncbi:MULTISPECIES: hypothetical protein [unclassified Pseudomonas]|uniref:Uncharacterized protein n=1 Tax=Pseudomonas sp. MYb327 TaxID=2745230 RepID=A0AAU8DYH4_9PSED